jgi:hypothetical protein
MSRTHGLSFADERLITQITNTDDLARRVPRLITFWDGVGEMREIIRDQGARRHPHSGSTGWWANGKMKYAGTVPVSIKAAIEMVDPGFFRSVEKVERFFAMHPEYRITEIQK